MIRVLITGRLYGKPESRTGKSGNPFVTAKLRVDCGEEQSAWASCIAFGAEADRLAGLSDGDAVSLAGRATLQAFQGKDGTPKASLSGRGGRYRQRAQGDVVKDTAPTPNTIRSRRFRAKHRRIDYTPSAEALAIIERRCRQTGWCLAGVIDALILAGDNAVTGNKLSKSAQQLQQSAFGSETCVLICGE